MEIERKDLKKPLNELEPGTVFSLGGSLYLLLGASPPNHDEKSCDNVAYKSVFRLEDNVRVAQRGSTQVDPKKCKIIVW